MSSYSILIVEDEQEIADSLGEMLEILNHQVIAVADSYDSAIKDLDKDDVEIVLLDIQLKGEKTGIDIAEKIKNEYKLPYIFTTAFADHDTITQAAAQSPYGYLVKPYGLKDINAAIEVAMTNYRNFKQLKNEEGSIQQNNLFVKVNSRLVRIDPEEVLFIEAKGDYVLFKTREKGYIVHSTIKNIEEKLDNSIFVKVHRSYIVNLKKIVDIEENNILIGELVIPVSRSQKSNLMRRLNTI